jgi:hypothetical protein
LAQPTTSGNEKSKRNEGEIKGICTVRKGNYTYIRECLRLYVFFFLCTVFFGRIWVRIVMRFNGNMAWEMGQERETKNKAEKRETRERENGMDWEAGSLMYGYGTQ